MGKLDDLQPPERRSVSFVRPEIDAEAAAKSKQAAMAADGRAKGALVPEATEEVPTGGSSNGHAGGTSQPSTADQEPHPAPTPTIESHHTGTDTEARPVTVSARIEDPDFARRIKLFRFEYRISEQMLVTDALAMYFAGRADAEIAESLKRRGAKLRRQKK